MTEGIKHINSIADIDVLRLEHILNELNITIEQLVNKVYGCDDNRAACRNILEKGKFTTCKFCRMLDYYKIDPDEVIIGATRRLGSGKTRKRWYIKNEDYKVR